LTDLQESSLQTDPQNPDSDNDTITDGDEVNEHDTNPLDQDTDNDGLQDAEEISNGTDPNDADRMSYNSILPTHCWLTPTMTASMTTKR